MPQSTADIRVLIIANDLLARAGLAALIGNEPGFKVVGQSDATDKLLTNVEIYNPDVIVLDTGWEPKAILERMAALAELGRPILMLVPSVDFAVEVWASGAWGVLLRDTSASHLTAALRTLVEGLMVLDPQLAPPPTPAAEQPVLNSSETVGLTARELEVLRLLALGLPNKSIAHRLNISEHTVKFHINSLLSKLHSQSRTEAVMRATRMGLIPL